MITNGKTVSCKGTLYLSVKMFTEKKFGSRAVEACLSEFARDERDRLTSIVAVGWYPLAPIIRFHRVLDRLYGKGDLALCVDVGRFSAEWQLNLFHKFILRFASPAWFYEKGAKLWATYFDAGRWELSQPTPTEIVARLHDFSFVDEAFCKRELGWFQRAAELTGAKQLQLEERSCRARGHATCEYHGRWA